MSTTWFSSADSLRSHGFTGFLSIRELRECDLQCVPGVRDDIGVYVVLRTEEGVPTFLAKSTGGRFKGRDPNVSRVELRAHWVDGTTIMYVGKAGSSGKSATLRSRLRQYLAFGAGTPIGHWGGRFIWHLSSSENLVVCWKKTPDEESREVERRMIQEFKKAFHDCRPFANLKD